MTNHCAHRFHLTSTRRAGRKPNGDPLFGEGRLCIDCGADLPLGPSNDRCPRREEADMGEDETWIDDFRRKGIAGLFR